MECTVGRTPNSAIRRTREFFEQARGLGFESINADLIYDLPKQTGLSFQKTLDLVVDLNPYRLAVFSYARVPTLKHQQRSFEKYFPSEPEKLQLSSSMPFIGSHGRDTNISVWITLRDLVMRS